MAKKKKKKKKVCARAGANESGAIQLLKNIRKRARAAQHDFPDDFLAPLCDCEWIEEAIDDYLAGTFQWTCTFR